MFFALSSSTVCAYAFSILFSKKPKLSFIICSSISGAVIFGSVASFASNIAIPIAVGIGSAFISVFWMSKVTKMMNNSHIFDAIGLFGSFFVVGLFGTLLVAPIVIKSFQVYGLSNGALNNLAISSSSEASWVLIYVGISSGIGLICGMINATLMRCL